MDNSVNSNPSVTNNLYAFLVQECAKVGKSLNSVIKEAGVSHQIVSVWKKEDPKTLTLINKVMMQLELEAKAQREKLAAEKQLYAGRHIRTWSGLYVDVFNPRPDMFIIEDIAIGLSRKYRFGGHTHNPITVAEHSVRVALGCSRRNRLAALLHDASEAYLSDIPSPIKNHLPEYVEIENKVMLCIAEKFGFAWPKDPDVEAQDKKQLRREWDEMVMSSDLAWPGLHAYAEFITAFKKYSKECH